MKKVIFIVVIGLAVYGLIQLAPQAVSSDRSNGAQLSASDQALNTAFRQRLSNIQVGGSGEVIRILPDDTEGSRHQKFLVGLASGQTLLIAHNIDVAPRIMDLRVGERVTQGVRRGRAAAGA